MPNKEQSDNFYINQLEICAAYVHDIEKRVDFVSVKRPRAETSSKDVGSISEHTELGMAILRLKSKLETVLDNLA